MIRQPMIVAAQWGVDGAHADVVLSLSVVVMPHAERAPSRLKKEEVEARLQTKVGEITSVLNAVLPLARDAGEGLPLDKARQAHLITVCSTLDG